MAKISPQALTEVKNVFQRYEKEVKASKLQQSASRTYLLHSRNFVRWLEDDFTPGGTL